jgi:hypothetical protein
MIEYWDVRIGGKMIKIPYTLEQRTQMTPDERRSLIAEYTLDAFAQNYTVAADDRERRNTNNAAYNFINTGVLSDNMLWAKRYENLKRYYASGYFKAHRQHMGEA